MSFYPPSPITGGGSLVAKSCPTLWRLPGASVHGILQARMLESLHHYNMVKVK